MYISKELISLVGAMSFSQKAENLSNMYNLHSQKVPFMRETSPHKVKESLTLQHK